MPRNPTMPPPNVTPVIRPGWITQKRRYKFITPLVGGGVKPTFPDPFSLVRGSAVRGQLRFWWRACRGASNEITDADRLADMRAREAAVWGMAALAGGPRQSQVSIRIAIENTGECVAWNSKEYSSAKYVLFPLDPETTSGPPRSGVMRTGVTFQLWLTYPESEATEVEAALWAWETFGGLGARTRRGAGALQCTAIDGVAVAPPKLRGDVEAAIHAGLALHLRSGTWPQATPHLAATPVLKVTNAENSPAAAWGAMISRLKAYRQQRRGALGRSLWPEPDTIRQRLLTSHYKGTLPATRLQLATVAKFPRGQFGLPIVFQFYREPVAGKYSVTLQGATQGRTRMASPLILRPVALANKACGIAIILQQEGGYSPPGGAVLEGKSADISITPGEVSTVQGDTKITINGTLHRLNSADDPVAHFVTSYL